MKDFGSPPGFDMLPLTTGGRGEVYKAVAPHVKVDGDWAEFGCRRGDTARMLIELMPDGAEFYAFDSFQGLPEPWERARGKVVPKGHFKCDPPHIKGATVVPGLFSKTLPGWTHERSRPLALIHLDCDLYSSARDVLEWMDWGTDLVPGSVIVIDDLCSYEMWRDGIWKAWTEWHDMNTQVEFRWIARGKGFGAMELR